MTSPLIASQWITRFPARLWTIPLALAAFGLPALAQPNDVRQAEIRDKDFSGGKCTAEVRVDGAVEIEIYGTTASMRTVNGAPGEWRRFDCNMGLPSNPNEFAFRPQEGRGRQTLVRTPADNRGAALILIEDPNGGRGGYKFDIEWRGGSDTSAGDSNIFSGVFGGGAPAANSTSGTVGGIKRGGPSTSVPGWNNQINSRNNGQGYLRTFVASDTQLGGSAVTIDRSGNVRITFDTRGRGSVGIDGYLVFADGDRLIANVVSNGTPAVMELLLGRNNRVEEMALTGTGRNRLELRWQVQ